MLEETEEFNRALKLVIKRQMRHLMDQLKEGGEEVFIMTVNMMNKTCSHFGSTTGEWFISEQEDLTNNFLNFCITHSKVNKGKAKKAQSTSVSRNHKSLLRQRSTSPAPSDISMTTSTPVFTTSPVKHTSQTGQRTLTVSIPKFMTMGVSEEDIAGFVGRVVAVQMSGAKKQKGLVKATVRDDTSTKVLMSPPAKKRKSSPDTTPTTSTRSGRKVSAKFLESMNLLRSKPDKEKSKDIKMEEDTNMPDVEDSSETLKQLQDVDPEILRRVEVTVDGRLQDIMSATLTNVGGLRKVILPILSELRQESTDLHDGRTFQVSVDTENETGRVDVSYSKPSLSTRPLEKMEEVEEKEEELADDDIGEDEWENMSHDDTELDHKQATTLDTGLRINKASSTIEVHKPKPVRKKRRKQPNYTKPAYEKMPLTCEICGITIVGRSNMKSHIRRIHLGQMDHKCDICNKFFWSAKRRDTHMMAVHTRQCDSCQDYVVESVPWEPGTNMRSTRDVLCNCGAVVSIFSKFGRRKQTEDKMDAVEGIEMSIKQNEDGTKYACGFCGKLFIEKRHCERHVNGHFSLKSCVCEVCGAAFTYDHSLRKHKIKEHGAEGLFCKYCNKDYSTPLTLKVHMSKVHSKEFSAELARNMQDGNTENDSQMLEEAAHENEKKDNLQPQVVVKKMSSLLSGSTFKPKTGSGKGVMRKIMRIGESGRLIQVEEKEEVVVETGDVETGAATEQIVLTSNDQVEHIVVSEQGENIEVSQLVLTSVQEPVMGVDSQGMIGDTQVVVCEESFVNSLRNGQMIGENGGVPIIIKQVE